MKKSTLIKLVKEQIGKTKLIKENKLAGDISSMVPDNTSYSEFAKAVATVLVDFYGKHNFDPFMKVLHSELEMGDSGQMNEDKGAILTKQQLIDKLKQLDPNFEVTIPTVTMSGTFDSHAGQQTTAKEAISKIKSAKEEGNFKQYNSGKDFSKFALVQSKQDQEKMEKTVKGAGKLD